MIWRIVSQRKIISPDVNKVDNCFITSNILHSAISSVNDSDIDTPTLHLRANTNIIDINVTEDDIKDVLKNKKTGKACGSDNISHQMLKGTASW